MENDTWMAVLAHLVAERDTTSKVINALFVMQFGFFFPLLERCSMKLLCFTFFKKKLQTLKFEAMPVAASQTPGLGLKPGFYFLDKSNIN